MDPDKVFCFTVFVFILSLLTFQSCTQSAGQLNAQGLVLLNEGNAKESVRYFQDALESKPDEFAILYNLAVAYHQSGKSSEAVKTFEQALQHTDEPEKYRLTLALLQLETGSCKHAIETLDDLLEKEPGDGLLLTYRGIAKMNSGNSAIIQAALVDFDKALKINPYNHQALLAKASAVRDSSPDAALDILGRALKFVNENSDSASRKDTGVIHWNLATLLMRMELPEKALEHLEEARKYLPKDQDVIKTLVSVYQNLNDFDKAQRAFSLLPANERNSFEGHLFAAWLLYGQRQYGRARMEVDKASALEPDNLHAMNLKGMIFARRGQYMPAIREFEKSILKDPSQEDIKQIVETLKQTR